MKAAVLIRSKLTPPEVAEKLRVGVEKVHGWIRNGELRAINVAKQLGLRPRYRIDVEDLKAFEDRRAVVPVPPPAPRGKRHKANNVIEFFK